VKETKDESAKATLPEEPEKQDIDQFADLILAEEEAIEGQPAQTGVKTEKSDITAGKVFLHTDTLAKQAEPLGRAAPTEDLDKASRARKSEAVSAVFGGRVIDESGAPLPGANILAGDRVGTIADTEGRFQLTLPPGENTVTVSFIGMEPRVVHLTEQGADIVLKDNGQEISEMAVVSYSRSADPPTYRATVTMPEPVGGRRSFNGYLAREVRYPQEARDKKISGRVVIDFTVDAGGAPVDFTIVRGIGAGCDEELIRLIREGPAWLPAAQNGKVIPATVRVRFRFDLP
jgi:TonB family protein